ncbi:outer membrane protein TolC [Granulicella aggregans]|uniref:Outer membrane protein TolC n=1 Tax=Granulicella aggregans TaxID=474949 RepID=A0A7W7ZG15_9BACT|nr:TolC family protein [Granulicella aggregans]MBB5059152.1 outer membrane protein TolC [Granulicella aggregans]
MRPLTSSIKNRHLDRSAAKWRNHRISLLPLALLATSLASAQTTIEPSAGAVTSPVTNQQTVPDAPRLNLPPITPFTAAPASPAPQLSRDEAVDTSPTRSAPKGLRPDFLGFLGPYRRATVPQLFPGTGERLNSLVKEGKLYLTLHDAIALAIENNLDVEVERYNIVLADTDLVRAKGGGSTRGIDFTIQEPQNGVGGPGSPLLNTAAVSTNPVTPTVTDLTSLNSMVQSQQNLSEAGTGSTYSQGPNIPLYDPSLFAESGYLQRSNTTTLTSTTGTDAGSTTTTQTGSLKYVTANVAYLQGFSTGAQIEATINNDSSVVYGSASQYDPFATVSTSSTVTQPLLRGRGREVNLRYLHIAGNNRKASRLLFEQQVLETIYGTSRLYFDLVSLGENVTVKQESLRASQKLVEDDESQVDQGTLAPIELTRARALLGSSQFDLIQAQGLYRQQEVILRDELIRTGSPVFAAQFTEIVPTDRILVPDQPDPLNVPDLIQQGLARRPDLAQAALQIKNGEISVKASRNQALPQLNLYGNVETRGSSEQAYEQLGSTGTGLPTIPQNFALGGLRTSTIYQGGVQLTLPLRNRVAQSDAARDTIQLRQAQARTEKLANQIREAIENAVIAVDTAYAAYKAATTSRDYQEQLLQSERDKLTVGSSTNLLVVQNETYLAQARSTEIAARSNWKKAQIDLDHAIGNLLDRNNIKLDDAISGTIANTQP